MGSGSNTLKNQKDFGRLKEVGKKLYCKNLLVSIAPNNLANSRLGLVVSKKIDKRAVVRNRIKRKLREIFRLSFKEFKGTFDIVIVARQNADSCSYAELERQLIGCLKHHGYLVLS